MATILFNTNLSYDALFYLYNGASGVSVSVANQSLNRRRHMTIPKYQMILSESEADSISATYAPFGPGATPTASIIGFINLPDDQQFYSEVELFSDQTIIVTGGSNLVTNVLASVSASTSSYAWFAHNLIQTRSLSDRYSRSLTGGFIDWLSYFREPTDLTDIQNDPFLGLGSCGVIAVKKIKYGEGIRPLHFTIATSAGVNFENTVSGDNSWGIMTRTSDGASAGIIFYDIGVALIHGPSLSAAQACSAVTAVTLQSTYKIWQYNAFCSAGADDFRYPNNDSAFYINGVTGNPGWNPSVTSYAAYGYQWGAAFTPSISAQAERSRGSYFLNRLGETWGPYITTIGLYNLNNECMAVAKVSTPIRKPKSYPITFRVAIDFD